MKKLLNFLLGSVRIQITGPFPERFLNLCGEENLGFWDVVRREDGALELSIRSFFLKHGHELAARCGCRISCEVFMGFPAFFHRLHRRYALLAGAVLAVAGAVFLSQFVLVVNVSGNETVADFVVLTKLEELGFGVGSYGPAVDERELSNRMLLSLPQLSYLNINLHGIYADVEVRERTPAPEIPDRSTPADMVAAVDGVVLDVNCFSGQSVVVEGQAVLAGETLISAVCTLESADGTGDIISTWEEHADGEVWAMTRRRLSAAIPLAASAKVPDRKGRRAYILHLGKKEIKIWGNSSKWGRKCDIIHNICALTLPGGGKLPLTLIQQIGVPFATTQKQLDEAQAQAYLHRCLEEKLTGLIGEGAQVLSRSWSTDTRDGVLTVTLEAACTENIARESQCGIRSSEFGIADE